jgi:hypothetical protein
MPDKQRYQKQQKTGVSAVFKSVHKALIPGCAHIMISTPRGFGLIHSKFPENGTIAACPPAIASVPAVAYMPYSRLGIYV